MTTPVSPEVRRYEVTLDRARQRAVTRKARGVLLALLAGLACWIGAAVAAGAYEFDIFAVWTDGRALYWAADSGCSCPTPFDGTGVSDLGLGRPADCLRALDTWQAERWPLSEDRVTSRGDQCLEVRVMSALGQLYVAVLVVATCLLLAAILVDAISGGLRSHEEREQ